MANKRVIEAIANTFVDRYSLERCRTQSVDDNYVDVQAIAAATAVAVLKAVELHSRVCRIRQQHISHEV